MVLLHGFAASTRANWEQPGVTAALAEAGYRAFGLDARGHGGSDKPHEPAAYPNLSMVRDVSALLDHLELESAAVVGYSMGSLTTAVLLPLKPRARIGVLGGVGHRMHRGRAATETDAIATAFEADRAAAVGDPTRRAPFARSPKAPLPTGWPWRPPSVPASTAIPSTSARSASLCWSSPVRPTRSSAIHTGSRRRSPTAAPRSSPATTSAR